MPVFGQAQIFWIEFLTNLQYAADINLSEVRHFKLGFSRLMSEQSFLAFYSYSLSADGGMGRK